MVDKADNQDRLYAETNPLDPLNPEYKANQSLEVNPLDPNNPEKGFKDIHGDGPESFNSFDASKNNDLGQAGVQTKPDDKENENQREADERLDKIADLYLNVYQDRLTNLSQVSDNVFEQALRRRCDHLREQIHKHHAGDGHSRQEHEKLKQEERAVAHAEDLARSGDTEGAKKVLQNAGGNAEAGVLAQANEIKREQEHGPGTATPVRTSMSGHLEGQSNMVGAPSMQQQFLAAASGIERQIAPTVTAQPVLGMNA